MFLSSMDCVDWLKFTAPMLTGFLTYYFVRKIARYDRPA